MIDAPSAISLLYSRNRRVYFDPLWGNHGDKLIELGTRKCIEACGGISLPDAKNADAIIVNGGGAMTPMWGGLKVLKQHIDSAAGEILVLPSSFWAEDALHELRTTISRSGKPVTIFARDHESHGRLLSAVGDLATIAIDHDMAFRLSLDDIALLSSIETVGTSGVILIVERRDAEASTLNSGERPVRIPLKEYVPLAVKRPLKRLLRKRQYGSTAFRSHCLELARKSGLPTDKAIYADISDTTQYSFKQFLRTVVSADMVFTTRLHVAILRHILGRPCLLMPTGGDYRKNESVFEYSMNDAGHVQLMET